LPQLFDIPIHSPHGPAHSQCAGPCGFCGNLGVFSPKPASSELALVPDVPRTHTSSLRLARSRIAHAHDPRGARPSDIRRPRASNFRPALSRTSSAFHSIPTFIVHVLPELGILKSRITMTSTTLQTPPHPSAPRTRCNAFISGLTRHSSRTPPPLAAARPRSLRLSCLLLSLRHRRGRSILFR